MEIVLTPLNWAPYTITQRLQAAREPWHPNESRTSLLLPACACLLGEAERSGGARRQNKPRSPHPTLPSTAFPRSSAHSRRLFPRPPPSMSAASFGSCRSYPKGVGASLSRELPPMLLPERAPLSATQPRAVRMYDRRRLHINYSTTAVERMDS